MKKVFKSIARPIYYFVVRMILRLKYPSAILESGSKLDCTSTFEGKNSIGVKTRFSGSIGRGSYIGNYCSISGKIGRYTSIGNNVSTISSTHPTNTFVSTSPMFFSTSKQNGYTYVKENKFVEMKYADTDQHVVIIGNDVWVGSNVILIGGITIGNGAIIAAGSVVTKNVADYEIVGGVPAKKIRQRFTTEQIAFLQQDEWWGKEETWLMEHSSLFCNIDEYISFCKAAILDERSK